MPKKKPQSSSVLTIPSSSVEPLLLDIRGAARVLSSSVWAVRSLLWSKEIPHIKIGRKFLIDPTDIRAFIERQKKEAA
jgi:excisionase family DNA binding protein